MKLDRTTTAQDIARQVNRDAEKAHAEWERQVQKADAHAKGRKGASK